MPSVISKGSRVHKKGGNLAPTSYPRGHNLLGGSWLILGGKRCVWGLVSIPFVPEEKPALIFCISWAGVEKTQRVGKNPSVLITGFWGTASTPTFFSTSVSFKLPIACCFLLSLVHLEIFLFLLNNMACDFVIICGTWKGHRVQYPKPNILQRKQPSYGGLAYPKTHCSVRSRGRAWSLGSLFPPRPDEKISVWYITARVNQASWEATWCDRKRTAYGFVTGPWFGLQLWRN